MRQLREALQPFKGQGASIRIEYKNRMFLTGFKRNDIGTIKRFKALLILILPEGQNYTIAQILEALERMIRHSEQLIVDAGYDVHGAELIALSIGRYYLNGLISIKCI